MSGSLVKICSLRVPEDGMVAAEAGADLVGLILAPARRQLSQEMAESIAEAVRALGPKRPRLVGVFVDERLDRLVALSERLKLDIVQLNGDEPPEVLADIGRPVIKALRLPAGTDLESARRLADRYLATPVAPIALLIDAHVAGVPGGSGRTADWDLATRLAEEYPIILAGGLRPENVAAAIEAVRPLGVDVSSGVEVAGAFGVKDHDKIRAFVGNARAAFGRIEDSVHLSQHAGAKLCARTYRNSPASTEG